MKKPENLYDYNGNIIQTVRTLEFIKDPRLCGDEKLGLEVGVISGETFLCEDSGLFNMTLSYTAVAKSDVIVYRIAVHEMLNLWPKECINELKIRVMEKYRWFYERLIKIEELLIGNKTNRNLLSGAKQIERHTKNNYP